MGFFSVAVNYGIPYMNERDEKATWRARLRLTAFSKGIVNGANPRERD
jgi:hypothetical protein